MPWPGSVATAGCFALTSKGIMMPPSACIGEVTRTVLVQRTPGDECWRVFLCERHAGEVDGDTDIPTPALWRELDIRRRNEREALAGRPHIRPMPVAPTWQR